MGLPTGCGTGMARMARAVVHDLEMGRGERRLNRSGDSIGA
jgi:hypothetical protein